MKATHWGNMSLCYSSIVRMCMNELHVIFVSVSQTIDIFAYFLVQVFITVCWKGDLGRDTSFLLLGIEWGKSYRKRTHHGRIEESFLLPKIQDSDSRLEELKWNQKEEEQGSENFKSIGLIHPHRNVGQIDLLPSSNIHILILAMSTVTWLQWERIWREREKGLGKREREGKNYEREREREILER